MRIEFWGQLNPHWDLSQCLRWSDFKPLKFQSGWLHLTFFYIWFRKYVSLSGANIPNFIVFSKTLSLAVLLCLAGVTDSYAKSEINEISQPSQSGIIDRKLTSTQTFGHRELRPQNTFDIFVPKPPTLNTKFDYTVWDKALSSSVVQMGPSLRRFARKARPNIGTRLVKKSQSSPYRLEGSRVTFHYFPDDYLEALTEYKQDLLQFCLLYTSDAADE